MTVLGIDTATFVTAVGLRRDGRVVSERRENSRGGHASSLPRLVGDVLRDGGLLVGDLDGIGVSVGPGSFTGLRVGVSFANAMAYVTGTALVGVSTSRALARAAGRTAGPVAVCLDARRGEVYLAVYGNGHADGSLEEIQQPTALKPEAALTRARDLGVRTLLGDAAARYAEVFAGLGAEVLDLASVPPSGVAVAEEATGPMCRGERAPAGGLVPRYVRASEAEVRRGESSLTMEKTL